MITKKFMQEEWRQKDWADLHYTYKHTTRVSSRRVSDLAINKRKFPASAQYIRSVAEILYFLSTVRCAPSNWDLWVAGYQDVMVSMEMFHQSREYTCDTSQSDQCPLSTLIQSIFLLFFGGTSPLLVQTQRNLLAWLAMKDV